MTIILRNKEGEDLDLDKEIIGIKENFNDQETKKGKTHKENQENKLCQ